MAAHAVTSTLTYRTNAEQKQRNDDEEEDENKKK